jgi:hypothetical protein
MMNRFINENRTVLAPRRDNNGFLEAVDSLVWVVINARLVWRSRRAPLGDALPVAFQVPDASLRPPAEC